MKWDELKTNGAVALSNEYLSSVCPDHYDFGWRRNNRIVKPTVDFREIQIITALDFPQELSDEILLMTPDEFAEFIVAKPRIRLPDTDEVLVDGFHGRYDIFAEIVTFRLRTSGYVLRALHPLGDLPLTTTGASVWQYTPEQVREACLFWTGKPEPGPMELENAMRERWHVVRGLLVAE